MLRISPRFALPLSLVSLLAGLAGAQDLVALPDEPIVFGHGTQGLVVYEATAQPNFAWFCGLDLTTAAPIGEVAEEVHMVSGGDLASFTFAYVVLSKTGPPASGLASATVSFYANTPTDSVTPGVPIVSYTIPDLPWEHGIVHTNTFDVSMPVAVPKDMWVGVEIDAPPGTVGCFPPATTPGVSPVVSVGSSHNLTWFGPSPCTGSGLLINNQTARSFVANYYLVIRLFFDDSACQYPVPDGSFETGALAPEWASTGPAAVVEPAFGTVPPSGGHQAAMGTGVEPSAAASSPVARTDVESFLGLAPGALLGFGSSGSDGIEGSAIRQTITAAAGETLQFRYQFLTDENATTGFGDFGFVSIDGQATLLADTFTPGFVLSSTPFMRETSTGTFSYTFPAAGTYTVGFGVMDGQVTSVDSALLVDCVELLPAVNAPPTCAADLTLAQMDFLEVAPGAFVVTEGETFVVPFTGTDPDGDVLDVSVSGMPPGGGIAPTSGASPLECTMTWAPIAADKAGAPYTVTVTFTDPFGASKSCDVTVADVNLRPMCSASDQTVACTGPEGASVTLDGSATDADGPDADLSTFWFVSDASVTLDDPTSPTPTGTFPVGVTMATLTVADTRGGVAVCDVLITVEDATPPEVMCTTDVAALWPPKHAMYPVSLIVATTDACSDPSAVLPITVTVTSSEPDDAAGGGDGNTTGDVDGQDGYTAPVDVTSRFTYDAASGTWSGTVLLRAERQGSGVGRKYTIDVSALDASGNQATTSCCVVVPHDRRSTP